MIKTEILKTPTSTPKKPILTCLSNPTFIRNDSKVQYSQQLSPHYERLIDKINKRIEKHEKWYSLEFFPPKTQQGASNLIAK
jgi:hypothetical protein